MFAESPGNISAVFDPTAQSQHSGINLRFGRILDVVANEVLNEPDGRGLVCQADSDFAMVRIEDGSAMTRTVQKTTHRKVDLFPWRF